MPQHRMLFAAYHYSLSGMPPSKTVEFLCKACDKVLHYNSQIPVSKVRQCDSNNPIKLCLSSFVVTT